MAISCRVLQPITCTFRQALPVCRPHGRPAFSDYSNDVCNCCITCLCPCITFGQITEIVDRGSTPCGVSGALYAMVLVLCVMGWACLYSCFYRSKMRGQYFLEESPCTDCLVHCF